MDRSKPRSRAHLPVELLQSIFSYAVADSQFVLPEGLRGDQRMRLLQVCSYWRAVAFQTPRLWDDVVINLNPRTLPIAAAISSRIPNTPRTIAVKALEWNIGSSGIVAMPSAEEFIEQLVLPFAASIKRLVLSLHPEYITSLLSPSQTIELPILESLSICPGLPSITLFNSMLTLRTSSRLRVPFLSTMEVGLESPLFEGVDALTKVVETLHLTTFVVGLPVSVSLARHFLSHCAALRSCGISLDRIDATELAFPAITMPHPEIFHIRFSSICHFDEIFSCFDLPSIRDLALKNMNEGISVTKVLTNAIISRCGPDLEQLLIASGAFNHSPYSLETFDVVLQKYNLTLIRLHFPIQPIHRTIALHIVGRSMDLLVRQLVSRKWCPKLELLSFGYTREATLRMGTLLDAAREAEEEGEKTLKGLHLHARSPIGDRNIVMLKNRFENFTLWYSPDSEEAIEKEWFG
jgi:F-box-like